MSVVFVVELPKVGAPRGGGCCLPCRETERGPRSGRVIARFSPTHLGVPGRHGSVGALRGLSFNRENVMLVVYLNRLLLEGVVLQQRYLAMTGLCAPCSVLRAPWPMSL